MKTIACVSLWQFLDAIKNNVGIPSNQQPVVAKTDGIASVLLEKKMHDNLALPDVRLSLTPLGDERRLGTEDSVSAISNNMKCTIESPTPFLGQTLINTPVKKIPGIFQFTGYMDPT